MNSPQSLVAILLFASLVLAQPLAAHCQEQHSKFGWLKHLTEQDSDERDIERMDGESFFRLTAPTVNLARIDDRAASLREQITKCTTNRSLTAAHSSQLLSQLDNVAALQAQLKAPGNQASRLEYSTLASKLNNVQSQLKRYLKSDRQKESKKKNSPN